VNVTIHLNPDEIAELVKSAITDRRGGFHGLLVALHKRLDCMTGALELTALDRERIWKYAFDYHGGGWQNTLIVIFGRSLGLSMPTVEEIILFIERLQRAEERGCVPSVSAVVSALAGNACEGRTLPD
jgi:hypothetical protein